MPPLLFCATSNAGKLAEFQAAAPPALRIAAAGPFDCPETGDSFEENASQKALCYARHMTELVFADDSGLEVGLLGGAPGIHSARYAGPHATDQQNRARLLDDLRRAGAGPGSRPRARFVCVLALARAGRLLSTFRGSADGEILEAPRGDGGFGYDPLFFFPPLQATFAEIDNHRKFACSHRGNAFRSLLAWLESA